METLSKLFGSDARVKLMRLFLFNPEEAYDIEAAAFRSKVAKQQVKKEAESLLKAGLLKKKTYFELAQKRKGKKLIEKRVKKNGFALRGEFPYLSSLRQLIASGQNFSGNKLVKRISKAGRMKLIIASGAFLELPDSRLDLLVVGDSLNRSSLSALVKSLEAELGRELLYAVFDTADFNYRYAMYDKLIMDVLDYPHEVLLNRLLPSSQE
jgi:hypothetical protein